MVDHNLFALSLVAIETAIASQKIASNGPYEIIWLKDHFTCRRMKDCNDDGNRIAVLACSDINHGLTLGQWRIIRIALKFLVRKEVVK